MRTILTKPKRITQIAVLLAVSPTLFSQNNILDSYIDSAFKNNIVLQQKNISLEKASYALEIAKGYYYPTVAFQAGYQTAGGGRDIYLPLGDLLNEAYATLNQLTQSNKFPQLKNERINFLPENFYDAKFRTTVPIINSDLKYNKEINKQQVTLSEYEIEIYKRELVKNIKTAYFNYRNALEAIAIYQSTLQLANEGKRVNEKLLENGKGLPAYILRSTSEIENVNAQITAAEQQAANARMYFNFLLNRNQDEPISTEYNTENEIKNIEGLLAQRQSPVNREELKMLQGLVSLNETALKMNKAVYYPKLNGFLDLGSQAQNWKFNSQSRYYMVGLQLDVPIFAGFRNRNKIKQSGLDVKNAELNLEQVKQQLQLAGNTAYNNLVSAYRSFQSSQKQLEAAQTYQRLIERGYREGSNTFIETVDARNQLTQAQLLVSINQYKVLAAAAGVERETASFNLNKL
ncbi:MAG: TolC family protein [Chitinophagaceae bacterium]|nr:TolC family protein [Chitinophagaceae bacterium]